MGLWSQYGIPYLVVVSIWNSALVCGANMESIAVATWITTGDRAVHIDPSWAVRVYAGMRLWFLDYSYLRFFRPSCIMMVLLLFVRL